MKKIIPFLVLVCLLIGITIIDSCKKEPVIPTLTTIAVTDITVNSGTTGGLISKDGGAAVTARGVCWGTTTSPTISGSHTSDANGVGSFTSNLTGLTPNTLYHVRAYATNKVGTAYGDDLSFTTTAIVVPTLTTTVVTSVSLITAVSGGNISSDGNGAITARGVCWATTTGPTITNSLTTDGTGTGNFVSNLSGLTSGVIYYVRAYATNSAGTAYGNEISFTTALGAPTNVVATAGNAQVTVSFTAPSGGSVITGYTVTSTPGGIAATGSASPITVTGLTNGTSYTFIVIATNANGNSSPSSASNAVIPSAVPGAPTIGIATAGNSQATVTFTAPASNGGSVITGYTVTSNPGTITKAGTTSPIIVTGLTNGTAYTFTVVATNANGNSSASSASNSVTPSSVPGAPTIGTATKGNAQATVTFTAPASNGGSVITGYTVTSSPGSFSGTGSASPLTVTGLTNGTAYTFTVVATNAIGNSLASSASNSVTPSTVPGAPTIGTATKGNAQATVTFTAPASNGGSVITGYTVTSSPGGFTGTGSASPLTVTGLTNGTAYTFTAIATNANGNSLASSASNSVTPSTIPGAPTIGTATAGNAQATVTFTAPASNGGSAITGYTVTSSPGSFTGTGSASPIIVTGLANDTPYTFTVVATNANGNSSPSSPSNSITLTTISDKDGNFYNTVSIGSQVWMAENLKTTKYLNGDLIGTTSLPTTDISGESSPEYQWAYDGDEGNVSTYGRLYTFFTVIDSRNICPSGWRIPSDGDWTTLSTYLIANGFGFGGSGNQIGKSMAAKSGWAADVTPGNVGNDQASNNTSGFTALPGGFRNAGGPFTLVGQQGHWRSSTASGATTAWYRSLDYNDAILGPHDYGASNGYSVRCLKN